jgi:hypothetical protein
MKLGTAVALVTVSVLGPVGAGLHVLPAQERAERDAFWRIRQEATTSSQILKLAQVLTDRYGPRPTGSPNVKAAGEWAIEQMRAWGLQNGRLEPWDFGHPGWLNERLSAHIISPVKDHLVAEALGWTPGTKGAVRGEAVQITLPARPTKEELATHLDALRSSVRGRIVLVGPHQRVPVTFNDPPERRDDREILQILDAPAPPPAGPPPAAPQTPSPRPREREVLSAAQVTAQLYEFLQANGAIVRVNDAARDHGQIRAFANSSYDPSRAIPTVLLRNEDYGRISRLLEAGQRVELEFEIANQVYEEGRTSYNATAEIPGATDEVVMLGGHLDSWHAATGATDNAIGCSVVLEAARILKALGVTPRRTIRVALWSGEEQGLRGSRAYVKEHFGTFEEPKPAYGKFGGYVNIDYGTGRPRYLSVFGPGSAGTVLREVTASFKDLGVLGARVTRNRTGAGGSSDHRAFDEAGLPGINVLQDPIEYDSHTWHSNLDTYERIVEEDAIKSAIVVAATVYHLATRAEPLPRFSKDEMPRRPGR